MGVDGIHPEPPLLARPARKPGAWAGERACQKKQVQVKWSDNQPPVVYWWLRSALSTSGRSWASMRSIPERRSWRNRPDSPAPEGGREIPPVRVEVLKSTSFSHNLNFRRAARLLLIVAQFICHAFVLEALEYLDCLGELAIYGRLITHQID